MVVWLGPGKGIDCMGEGTGGGIEEVRDGIVFCQLNVVLKTMRLNQETAFFLWTKFCVPFVNTQKGVWEFGEPHYQSY